MDADPGGMLVNSHNSYVHRVVARAKSILGYKETHAILIMLLLLVPTFVVLLLTTAWESTYKQFQKAEDALNSVANEVLLDEKSGKNAINDFNALSDRKVEFMAAMARSLVTDEGYIGPRVFGDGVVAEIVDGQLVFPEGTHSALLDITFEEVKSIIETEEPGVISIETGSMQFGRDEDSIEEFDPDDPAEAMTVCFLRAALITPDLVYIDVTPEDDLWSSIGSKDYATKAFEILEKTFGGVILVCNKNTEDLPVVYHSSYYPEINSAGELDITLNNVENDYEVRFIRNDIYLYTSKYLEKYDCYAIFLYPLVTISSHLQSRTLFIVMTMAIVLSTLITYLFASMRYARSGKLTEDELEGFHPYRLKNHAIAIGIVGVLVVFAVTFFVHLLGAVQTESITAEQSLTAIFEELEQDRANKRKAIIKESQSWYANFATRLADLVSDYPQIATKENLQQYCNILGVNYIMLFDTKGNETLCSTDYVGFSLGTGQGDESGDFRRLLRGVRTIAHGASVDSVTGIESYNIGATIPTPDRNANGALLMSVPPENIYDASDEPKTNDQLAALATEDMILFSVNAETETVVNSSNPYLCNEYIEDCGLRKKSMSDDYMDFARIFDKSYLVVTCEGQSLFYYYAINIESLLFGSGVRIACAVLTFIAMFIAIERFSLKDYTVEEFEAIVPIEAREDPDQDAPVATRPRTQGRGIKGLITTILDPDRSLMGIHDMRPSERTRFVLGLLLCILVVIVYVYESDSSANPTHDNRQLLNFILEGNWMRGPNIFAFSSILIMSSGAFLLVSACRWTLRILSSFLESKGKTICRLLNNFVGYLALAVVIYFSLSYLGIPAGTVLGSLGLSGLALTFGAREIIADILSGISIIFEGDYQVGDIVEIDGFRGTVKEISVRATHLLNAEGNYKIVRNMDIRKLTNMSKRHSRYTLSILIPNSESLAQVEEDLVRGLATIEPHPKLISGPTYVGVTSIGPDKMTLLIDAECLERDMNAVSLYLNREIRLMLEREGINAK